MKNRSFWTAIAWAVPAGLISLALVAEPSASVVHSRAGDPLNLKLLDRIETRLSRQLRESGITIQQPDLKCAASEIQFANVCF